MIKALICLVLLMLTACAQPVQQAFTSACTYSEVSYECQVERYNKVSQ